MSESAVPPGAAQGFKQESRSSLLGHKAKPRQLQHSHAIKVCCCRAVPIVTA
jgi:hypothetical protein